MLGSSFLEDGCLWRKLVARPRGQQVKLPSPGVRSAKYMNSNTLSRVVNKAMMSFSSARARGDGGVTSLPSSLEFPKRKAPQITSFYLCLCLPSPAEHAPRSLKLVYTSLEAGDSELRHGARTAAVPLYRVWNPSSASPGEAVYTSTDPLTAACCSSDGTGIRFEAYVAEQESAAEGLVYRDREGRWGMECWLAPGVLEVRAVGDGVDLRRSARWSPRARRQRRRREPRFVSMLQRIPEEEVEEDETPKATALDEEKHYGGRSAAEDGYDGRYRRLAAVPWEDDRDGWKTGSYQSGRDGDGCEAGSFEELRWVVDMGVWAVCVGVGLLLSRAAGSGLRKGFFLL